MGLLKKLKKIHKKSIAHKLVTKVDPLGKKMFGKKGKGSSGGGSTPRTTAAAGPQTATARLAARPALARDVAAAQAAAKKPLRTGGPGQKIPVPSPTLRTGGGAQRTPVTPALRTGGGAQKTAVRSPGVGLTRNRTATPNRPAPTSAGVNLARIAKGYKTR